MSCCLPWGAAAQGTALSQRRINEMAARLQSARLKLIEATGLRRPQEPLRIYFERIVDAAPNETYRVRQCRIQGYLDALATATHDTAAFRQVPLLRHNDALNRQQWQRATLALKMLPACVAKARAAWEDIQREEMRKGQSSHLAGGGAPYHRLGAELTQALELVLVAYNALRDARP